MPELAWLPSPLSSLVWKWLGRFRLKTELGLIPVGLSVLTLVFAAIGWTRLVFDGSFHSIVVIAFSTLGSFRTTFSSTEPVRSNLTDAAALCGLLTIYSSGAVLAGTLLRNGLARLSARLFYAGHVVVIGDSPIARQGESVWRKRDRRTLRIAEADGTKGADDKKDLLRHAMDDSFLEAFAVHRADHVLIDLGEDTRTLSFSLMLLSQVASIPGTARGEPQWFIVARDVALADKFAGKVAELKPSVERQGFPSLHYIDPDRLTARHFLATNPLFILAERQQHERIHLLFVGFGSLGRHLAELALLTPSTASLFPCVLTVLTPQPDVERRRFFSARAALADLIDIEFLGTGALEDFQLGATPDGRALKERQTKAPFTAALLLSDTAAENVRNAVLIDMISRRSGAPVCPTFCREDVVERADLLSSSSAFGGGIGGFTTFGLPDDVIREQLCDSERRDLLARGLHDLYSSTAPQKVPWEDLSENLRRANRNAADHWAAKMHMLGFEVDRVPPGRLAKLSDEDADLIINEMDRPALTDALEKIMRCEHERWVIERHLNGWSHGESRDDLKQSHPLLVSWDVLVQRFPSEVQKNGQQLAAVTRLLAANGDPDFVLERRKLDPTPVVSSDLETNESGHADRPLSVSEQG